MEYLIGVALAAVVCVFAMVAGFGRDRVFYPTVLAAMVTYYILFAALGSSTPALIIASLVAGTLGNLWVNVAPLAGDGVFGFCHHVFIHNPGVPVWWPGFCLSLHVLAGGFLARIEIMKQCCSRCNTRSLV